MQLGVGVDVREGDLNGCLGQERDVIRGQVDIQFQMGGEWNQDAHV